MRERLPKAALIAGIMLAAISPEPLAANQPHFVLGESGDPWEASPAIYEEGLERPFWERMRFRESLEASQVELLPDAAHAARLNEASVQALDASVPEDRAILEQVVRQVETRERRRSEERALREELSAAAPEEPPSADEDRFQRAARINENARLRAEETQAALLTRYEQIKLSRISELLTGVENPRYRAFLVRAFRWGEGRSNLQASLCGQTVRIVLGNPSTSPQPVRAAALVIVRGTPTHSFVQWIERVIPAAPMLQGRVPTSRD